MIFPAPQRYFAPAAVPSAGAKFRGGVGEIISPTSEPALDLDEADDLGEALAGLQVGEDEGA